MNHTKLARNPAPLTRTELHYFNALVDKVIEPALATDGAESPTWDRTQVLRRSAQALKAANVQDTSRVRIMVGIDDFLTEYQDSCAAHPLGDNASESELGRTLGLISLPL